MLEMQALEKMCVSLLSWYLSQCLENWERTTSPLQRRLRRLLFVAKGVVIPISSIMGGRIRRNR